MKLEIAVLGRASEITQDITPPLDEPVSGKQPEALD
jgi:hypothetical protein